MLTPDMLETTMDDSLSEACTPSYVTVQEQMRDLVMIQDQTIGNLARTNVETLSASRDIFDATLREKECQIGMLEKSITTDYVPLDQYAALLDTIKREFVPREDFESLQREMQVECEKHAETQATLEDVVGQLDHSHERIKLMEQQRESDITSFNTSYNELRKELSDTQEKNVLLQSKLNEMQQTCDHQQAEMSQQGQQIAELETQREMQSQKYRHKLHESEVEKQQEAYLQRMMADTHHKQKKRAK